MPSSCRRVLACLAWALAAAPAPVWALSFSGSFAGIARVTPLPFGDPPDHPPSFYDGADVTGTFSVHIPDDHLADARANTNVSLGSGGFLLTFAIRGEQFSFRGASGDSEQPGVMQAFQPDPDAPAQRVQFRDVFSSRFHGAAFHVGSDTGSLFEGDDLGTLRIAPDTVSSFDAGFTDFDEKIQVAIDVASFRIAPLASPVPEPASGALLMLGLAGLALHQRRALRTASRSVPSCTPTVSSITRP